MTLTHLSAFTSPFQLLEFKNLHSALVAHSESLVGVLNFLRYEQSRPL